MGNWRVNCCGGNNLVQLDLVDPNAGRRSVQWTTSIRSTYARKARIGTLDPQSGLQLIDVNGHLRLSMTVAQNSRESVWKQYIAYE